MPTSITCSKCRYKWNYKGKRTFYATCPQCMRQTKLPTIPTATQE